MAAWSCRVGSACYQANRCLVSRSCQHLGVHRWELMAETSQNAIFLTPAVPLLHPAPCPSSGEGNRWAAPRWHMLTCREERAAPVACPRCKGCCWQAGSSVAWQQASERRLLCPCSQSSLPGSLLIARLVMHGGDNPGSVSSNSVCHQTENTWAESTEPCAKLIWYQPCGCGSLVQVFLCLSFCREDWNLPSESPSVPHRPVHNLHSPSSFSLPAN